MVSGIMNGIDIVLLIVVVACVLRGFFRGVWPEVLDLSIWLAAVVLSVLLVQAPAGWISQTVQLPVSLAVLIVFFGLHGIIKGLLWWGVHFIIDRGKTSFGQRLSGMAAGFIRGIFAAGIFAFLILNFTAIRKPNWEKEKSVLLRPLSRVAPALYSSFTTVVPRSRPVFERMKEGFIWCADRIESWGGPHLEPSGDDERSGT
jgi:uncharacterized membrane protein required for colicin V production